MVVKESAGGKGRSAQDAEPAGGFGSQQRIQPEEQSHCDTNRQQRTDKLPQTQSEKDGFLIVPDLFNDFDFDK